MPGKGHSTVKPVRKLVRKTASGIDFSRWDLRDAFRGTDPSGRKPTMVLVHAIAPAEDIDNISTMLVGGRWILRYGFLFSSNGRMRPCKGKEGNHIDSAYVALMVPARDFKVMFSKAKVREMR